MRCSMRLVLVLARCGRGVAVEVGDLGDCVRWWLA